VASVLALCSHYFAVFLIIGEGLVLLRSLRPRRRVLAALAAPALVGLILAPLAIAQEHAGPENLSRSRALVVRAGQALVDFVASVEPGQLTGSVAIDAVPMLAAAGAAALLVTAIVLVIRTGRSRERSAAARIGFVAATSFALPMALAAAGFDFVEARKVLIGSVTPLLVLVAIGLGSRRAGRVGALGTAAGATIFAGVLAVVLTTGQMQRANWRAAARAVGPADESRVFVVASSGQVPLAYYLHAADFRPGKGRGRIRAREIDTVGKDYAADPPGDGFRLVTVERVAGSFWVRRYRSPAPTLVTAREVGGNRILDEPSLDLANRAPHSAFAARPRPTAGRGIPRA
jgi:hypothetical protein